jgi:shikimate kinase
MSADHLYLIGMMGAGKSATGKKLAALLRRPFMDIDSLIEKRHGMSIADLFARKGESFFRDQETALLNEISSETPPAVFATGGGIVLRSENVERMRETGRIVYLETSTDVLWERVKGKSHRPLLKVDHPREALAQILNKRRELYREAAHWTVNTDELTADAAALRIHSFLKEVS